MKPKNSIIKQYQLIFEMENIKLDFTDGALEMIIDQAIKLKTGARGLRSSLEKVMFKLMYESPDSDVKKLTIDKKLLKKEFDAIPVNNIA